MVLVIDEKLGCQLAEVHLETTHVGSVRPTRRPHAHRCANGGAWIVQMRNASATHLQPADALKRTYASPDANGDLVLHLRAKPHAKCRRSTRLLSLNSKKALLSPPTKILKTSQGRTARLNREARGWAHPARAAVQEFFDINAVESKLVEKGARGSTILYLRTLLLHR